MRNEVKGYRGGTQQLEHLGVPIAKEKLRVYSSDENGKKVTALAQKLMLLALKNRRFVSLYALLD